MSDKLRYIIIASIIGIIVAIATFRLAMLGKLPIKISSSLNNQSSVTNNETRTIIQEENAIISVVEKTSPSVVAIGVTQKIVNPFDPYSLPRNRQSTIGTGFIVSEKGIIVTNRHVVDDPSLKYSVVTRDGKKVEIDNIYRDPSLDLALVQVKASDLNLKSLEIGDSGNLKVGQTVIAIGNALGRFSNTVTTGIVSGLGRDVSIPDFTTGTREDLDNLIQTDAAINPGNSGGPLLNSAGQVIGVNVATTEGAQNIGFAIPINSVKAIVDEFVATGKISRAFLGIRYVLVSRDVAILNEIPQGAYIQEVVEGSGAQKAGIKVGDIITKIDNQAVNQNNTISDLIQKKKPRDNISLEVWSDGQTKTLTATLQEASGQ